MERIQKQKIFFRGYFTGLGLHKSMMAMEIAMQCHTGNRRDGNPEVSHQFDIVGMLIQVFEKRMTPAELDILIASAFLHDVVEDYPSLYDQSDILAKFGCEVSDIVARVTKKANFKKTPEHRELYYKGVLGNLFSTFVKCFDRIHNLQSMIAGFTPEGQRKYIIETEEYFYQMIKKSRSENPQFYIVFVIIQQQMEMIISLAEEVMNKNGAKK